MPSLILKSEISIEPISSQNNLFKKYNAFL